MEFHAIADIFPMMSAAEFAGLRDDIEANGLREAIWVYEDKILDGRNRFNACQELGIKPRYRTWKGDGEPLDFVVSLNLHRRHLSESQRGMVAGRLATLPAHRPELSTSIDVLTQEEAASKLNVGIATVQRARKVLDQGTPELIEAVDSGLIAVSQAVQLAETPAEYQQEIIEKIESGEAKNVMIAARQIRYESMGEPMPITGKYRVVYADPPWSYGNSGPIGDTDHYGHVERHYPSMTIAELCDLQVSEAVEDDAVLFLWVTSPLLEEAFTVISAWGFHYKSSFVWDKVRHNFGYYNSVRHEFLLVCTRGSCTPDVKDLVDSVIEIERTDKHSEKPEEFRQLIERLYPRGSRIELFARRSAPGWELWGNEVETVA